MTGDDSPGSIPPDDAFGILGHETRIAVLRALWDAHHLPHYDVEPIPFSEIYEAVDTGDTGNFNYHLDQLVGPFVERSEDGYRLTRAGFGVVQSVLSGTLTDGPELEPTRVDAACPLCDAPVEVAYDAKFLNVYCSACEGTWRYGDQRGFLIHFDFPPAGVEGRSAEEAFRACIAYTLNRIQTYQAGVCPDCAGRVESHLDVCENHATGERTACENCERTHMIEVVDICQRCKSAIIRPLRATILERPVVAAFDARNGVEYRFASWEAYRRSHAVHERLISTEPLRLELVIPADDERLHLSLDADLTVVDATRESVTDADQQSV